MTVHGATSSPTCANYAMQQTAKDNAQLYSDKVVQMVAENFYMDDCLKSLHSVNEAITLSIQLTSLLKKGGFHLTKWLSNSKEVLTKVSQESKNNLILDVTKIGDGVQKVLGVKWDFENDCFRFNVNINQRPLTQRGVLSIVGSLFDPLRFAAPVVLKAKLILQNLCHLGLGWDELIPDRPADAWKKWITELPEISCLQINQCFRYLFFEKRASAFFADASKGAYGVVTYIRVHNICGKVSCNFLIGKARLA